MRKVGVIGINKEPTATFKAVSIAVPVRDVTFRSSFVLDLINAGISKNSLRKVHIKNLLSDIAYEKEV